MTLGLGVGTAPATAAVDPIRQITSITAKIAIDFFMFLILFAMVYRVIVRIFIK